MMFECTSLNYYILIYYRTFLFFIINVILSGDPCSLYSSFWWCVSDYPTIYKIQEKLRFLVQKRIGRGKSLKIKWTFESHKIKYRVKIIILKTLPKLNLQKLNCSRAKHLQPHKSGSDKWPGATSETEGGTCSK